MRSLILTLLFLVPLVAASTSTWMEIDDPVGETETYASFGFSIVNTATPEIDLDLATVAVSEDQIRASFVLRDATFRTFDDQIRAFTFAFDGGSGRFGFITVFQADSPDYPSYAEISYCVVIGPDNQVEYFAYAPATLEGNTVSFACEANAFAGLQPTVASSILAVRDGPASWSGGGNVWFRDWTVFEPTTVPVDLFATAPRIFSLPAPGRIAALVLESGRVTQASFALQ